MSALENVAPLPAHPSRPTHLAEVIQLPKRASALRLELCVASASGVLIDCGIDFSSMEQIASFLSRTALTLA